MKNTRETPGRTKARNGRQALVAARKLWLGQEGAAFVEFALVIPFLLVIIWGVVDFTRAYYTSNSLANAVREGARYAAVQLAPSTKEAAIDSIVRKTFSPLGGAALTNTQINVYDSTLTRGKVTVEVKDYQWLKITPITVFVGGKFNFTRSATFRWEREVTN